MKKIHSSILSVILLCIIILGILGYIALTSNPTKEIPPTLITALSSIVSGLLGYVFGGD